MNLWQWTEGEERIRRALQYNPQAAHVEHLYSTILLAQGRYDEALEHVDRALSMEHSSLFLRSHRAQVLLFFRRLDECIREGEDLLEENPQFAMGLMNYGTALLSAGRASDAVLVLERAYSVSPIPIVLAALAEAQYVSELRKEADETVGRLRQLHLDSGVSPTVMALGCLATL
jgi:tetratricopeptide (TPR) repeat protein